MSDEKKPTQQHREVPQAPKTIITERQEQVIIKGNVPKMENPPPPPPAKKD
ncbi:MAG: hypothetical protein KA210_01310 [Bacteroidia bacterium]|jgi:hypothetical protein|uniref:hypothetical protein n=1 Tax=Flavobacterium sp. TaxID=239 RepID=UPI001B59507B|nr:hypothetical protein [Bacteroidia bacterium]